MPFRERWRELYLESLVRRQLWGSLIACNCLKASYGDDEAKPSLIVSSGKKGATASNCGFGS